MRNRIHIFVLSLAVSLVSSLSYAEENPVIAEIGLQLVAEGFLRPVFLTSDPDDASRLFIVEQPGRIWLIEEGVLGEQPYLDITDRVTFGGEMGLLSMAIHPEFRKRRAFFVNYIQKGELATVVSRFRTRRKTPDEVKINKEKVFLRVPQPYTNHNGGQLQFGPDGYLYIAFGDGGSAADPLGNGQNLGTFHGSILRLNVSKVQPYLIPSDNPFVGRDGLDEVWSYGFRNPWRFSFDRLTGDMYIADVGQSSNEEISFQPADSSGGENYGWALMEGTKYFKLRKGASTSNLVKPIYEYTHQVGKSISGGYVYRGDSIRNSMDITSSLTTSSARYGPSSTSMAKLWNSPTGQILWCLRTGKNCPSHHSAKTPMARSTSATMRLGECLKLYLKGNPILISALRFFGFDNIIVTVRTPLACNS